MSIRERILTIRLLEMVEKNPAFAKALGIEVPDAKAWQEEKTDPEFAG